MLKIKKYFSTDSRQLILNSFFFAAGSSLQRAVFVAASPLITYLLTPAEYGILGLLMSIPAIVVPLITAGISVSSGVLYFSSDEEEYKMKVMTSSLYFVFFTSLFLVFLAVILSDLLSAAILGGQGFEDIFIFMVIAIFFTVLFIPYQMVIQFRGLGGLSFKLNLASSLVYALSLLVFGFYLNMGIEYIIFSYLLGQASLLLFMRSNFSLISKSYELLDFSVLFRLIKVGLPFIPSLVFMFVMQYSLRWPLSADHGYDSVGVFSLAFTIASVINIFSAGMNSAWTPWVMGLKNNWTSHQAKVSVYFSALLIGFVVITGMLWAPMIFIVDFAISSDFRGTKDILLILLAFNVVIGLYSFTLFPLYMKGRTYLVLVSQAPGAMVVWISFYFLSECAELGAAISMLLGACVMLVTHATVLRQTCPEYLPEIKKNALFLVIVFIFILMYVFLLLITDFDHVHFALASVVFTLVILAVGVYQLRRVIFNKNKG